MPDYRIPAALAAFSRRGVESFDGMLNKSAAVTAALAAVIIDRELSWAGRSFLEIGVFKGKFFSLIAHATENTGARLIGIDPFDTPEHDPSKLVAQLAASGLDTSRISFLRGLSSETESIAAAVGGTALSLCHIDGSHAEDDVYLDIETADEMLSGDGIVIADDFWNKSQLGVATAVFRHTIEDRVDLKPFMISNTKIYLSRADMTETWKNRFIEGFRQNPDFTLFADWVEKRTMRPRRHSEQLLSKWPVLLI